MTEIRKRERKKNLVQISYPLSFVPFSFFRFSYLLSSPTSECVWRVGQVLLRVVAYDIIKNKYRELTITWCVHCAVLRKLNKFKIRQKLHRLLWQLKRHIFFTASSFQIHYQPSARLIKLLSDCYILYCNIYLSLNSVVFTRVIEAVW